MNDREWMEERHNRRDDADIDREYYEGCIEELRKALEEIDAVAMMLMRMRMHGDVNRQEKRLYIMWAVAIGLGLLALLLSLQ